MRCKGEESVDRRECVELSLENMKWYNDNEKALKEKYDKKWIAIRDGKVVEVDDRFQPMAKRVQARDDRDCLLVQYISKKPVALFF